MSPQGFLQTSNSCSTATYYGLILSELIVVQGYLLLKILRALPENENFSCWSGPEHRSTETGLISKPPGTPVTSSSLLFLSCLDLDGIVLFAFFLFLFLILLIGKALFRNIMFAFQMLIIIHFYSVENVGN